MKEDVKELIEKIAEKNRVLKIYSQNKKANREAIYRTSLELDQLLYLFYKKIRCA